MTQPIQMAMTRARPMRDPLSAIERLGSRAARDGIYLGLIIALLTSTALAAPQTSSAIEIDFDSQIVGQSAAGVAYPGFSLSSGI